jgi:hypothetical protein
MEPEERRVLLSHWLVEAHHPRTGDDYGASLAALSQRRPAACQVSQLPEPLRQRAADGLGLRPWAWLVVDGILLRPATAAEIDAAVDERGSFLRSSRSGLRRPRDRSP